MPYTVLVSDTPKRRPGRPRKNPLVAPAVQSGEKRKFQKENEEDEEKEKEDQFKYEDSEDEAEKEEKIEEGEEDDMDKDYSPLKDLDSSKRRILPKRRKRGRNNWLSEDYVVIKAMQNGSMSTEEREIAEAGTDHNGTDNTVAGNRETKVNQKTLGEMINPDKPLVKRGRGRPRKIKDIVATSEENELVSDLGKSVNEEDRQEVGQEVVNVTEAKAIDTPEVSGGESLVCIETNTNSIEKETSQESGKVSMKSQSQQADLDEQEEDIEEPDSVNEHVDILMVEEDTGEEKYVCTVCQEKFSDRSEAVSHSMSHKIVLEETNKDENTKESSEKTGVTEKLKQRDKDFSCDICHQSFKTAQYLYRHMIMHTDVYNCVKCKKTFSRKDSLQKHVLKCCPELAENYKIYACFFCSRVFSTKSGHLKHSKKCQSVQCKECKKIFSSSQELSSHICSKDETDDVMDGKFACGICPKTFQSYYYLKQHTLMHKSLHSCDRCGKSLPSEIELEEHVAICKTVESIKMVGKGKCDKCEEEFNNAKVFREHFLSHTHPYQCDKCFKRFVKIGTLTVHDCQQSMDGCVCNDCGKGFKTKYNLERHVKEHGCWKYECSECGEHFHRKLQATNHLCNGKYSTEAKIVNISDSKEICHECGKSYFSKSNLTKHMLLHGEKTFTCPHCDKKFHLEVYLKDHIACVHFNMYKYQCTQCGKMLKSKTGLLAHTKLFHSSKVSTYTCPKCGKVFKQKGNLKTHMFSHSTERKFACGECTRTFKYPDQLSRHRVEHQRVEKHACNQCGKLFFRAYELRRHMRCFHSGYVYVCAMCSARCGHRHTLIRHYKRKHPEDSEQLSHEGFIDGMLKHVNELYPMTNLEPEEMALPNPAVASEEGQPETLGPSTEMLSRDAAEALHSLALGNITARQYQLLKDKGLFQESLPLATPADQVTVTADQSVMVSEESRMVHPQEVIQQEQIVPQEQIVSDGITGITSVAMDTTLGIVPGKDLTININGLQGLSHNIEGLETAEGQIVILQIVDPESHDVTSLVQGEVIQQMQAGEITQESGGESQEVAEEVMEEDPNVLTISEDGQAIQSEVNKEIVNGVEQRQLINLQFPGRIIRPENTGEMGEEEPTLEKEAAEVEIDQVGDFLGMKQVGGLLAQGQVIQIQQGEVIQAPHEGNVIQLPNQAGIEIHEVVNL